MCIAVLAHTEVIWLPHTVGPWKGWPNVGNCMYAIGDEDADRQTVLVLRTHSLNPFPAPSGDYRLPSRNSVLRPVYLVLTKQNIIGFVPQNRVIEFIGEPPPVSEVGFDGTSPSRMEHDI